jgi:molecular chaperone Hsp33
MISPRPLRLCGEIPIWKRNMPDYLVRCVSDKANVIGLACVTTRLVDEAAHLHGTSRTASAALGRALTGALLMGALAKKGQRVGLKFEGNGPLRKIMVEADSEGNVRGLVAVPEAEVPPKDDKLNVSGALGNEGTLTVVKDLGLKEPYRGIVKLHTGEIAEDIAYYYVESEQIPSAVGLGVFVEPDGKVTAAGGFLIQTLPPEEDGVVDRLVKNIQGIPFITQLIRQGKAPEDLLHHIFSGIAYRILEKQELFYRCPCSKERVEKALITLGMDEIKKLMAEREETDVTCEYCRTTYRFSRKDLEDLQREVRS